MEIFLHIVGWSVLWIIGMFVVPLLVAFIWGIFTNFNNDEDGAFIFWIAVVLYWIISGIILISL